VKYRLFLFLMLAMVALGQPPGVTGVGAWNDAWRITNLPGSAADVETPATQHNQTSSNIERFIPI